MPVMVTQLTNENGKLNCCRSGQFRVPEVQSSVQSVTGTGTGNTGTGKKKGGGSMEGPPALVSTRECEQSDRNQ